MGRSERRSQQSTRTPGAGTDQSRNASRPLRNPRRTAMTVVLIVLMVGGLTALAITMGDDQSPVTAIEQVAEPQPWEYNQLTNQHWHPGHKHWHDGPPPEQGMLSGDGVAAPPGITNPKPWQYDEATDRHYDPAHAHWHSGKPPAGAAEGTFNPAQASSDVAPAPPGITNPEPWQYDAATDRHYDPNHAHWHTGKPPAPADR